MMGWLMMKTCQASQNRTLKKRGKGGTRWKDPQKKKPPMKVDFEGNMNKSNIQTPSSHKEHVR
jgi:hypothetical protein